MKKIPLIIGTNLAILLFYNFLVHLTYKNDLEVSISLAFFIAVHCIGNFVLFIVALIYKKKFESGALILSVLVILVIGFSLCAGGTSI